MATLRSTMSDLIARVRMMIQDVGSTPFFQDLDIQNVLDESRADIRYEPLMVAPTLLNAASTGNQAGTIFADYYSQYGFWEADVVLQGVNTATSAAWVVLTPASMELLLDQAHFVFENSVFTSGTVPGQYPPVFATGKVYDVNCAAADLLERWAMSFSAAYDISVDGQNLRRSQLMTAKQAASEYFRRRAKPTLARSVRGDVMPDVGTRRYRLLDSDDVVKGG